MSTRLNSWISRFRDFAPLAMLRLADLAVERTIITEQEAEGLVAAACHHLNLPSRKRFAADLKALLESRGYSIRRRIFRGEPRFVEARIPWSGDAVLTLVPREPIVSTTVTASPIGVQPGPSIVAKRPRKQGTDGNLKRKGGTSGI
jgi:hypothetical protein